MAIKQTHVSESESFFSTSRAMSPDSIFSQKDEGEATAISLDQDKLQLVINVVDMDRELTCKNGLL